MLTEVKNHLKYMFVALKYNLSKEMANRLSFIMQIVFMMLNNSTFIIQWLILFNIKDNIGGYGINEVLILWSVAAASFGVSHMFFHNLYELPELITNGKLDVYLTQPKNVLFSVAVSKVEPSAIGDLLYGYVLFMIIKFDVASLLLFTVFAITGGLIMSTVAAIAGSITFWIKKGDMVAQNINSLMLQFGTYPDSIFKTGVRLMFYLVVPIGFMSYMPVSVIRDFNPAYFGTIIIVVFTLTLLAFIIFNKGLKRYSSSNLMSTRI